MLRSHRVHPFAGSAYSTSKAALRGLTRELAADLAPLGIRVNRRLPGRDQHRDPLARHRPAGLAHPHAPTEVAAVILYLCSAQVSYVTGAKVPVNGNQDVH